MELRSAWRWKEFGKQIYTVMLKGGAKYFDAKRHAKKDHYGERTPEQAKDLACSLYLLELLSSVSCYNRCGTFIGVFLNPILHVERDMPMRLSSGRDPMVSYGGSRRIQS